GQKLSRCQLDGLRIRCLFFIHMQFAAWRTNRPFLPKHKDGIPDRHLVPTLQFPLFHRNAINERPGMALQVAQNVMSVLFGDLAVVSRYPGILKPNSVVSVPAHDHSAHNRIFAFSQRSVNGHHFSSIPPPSLLSLTILLVRVPIQMTMAPSRPRSNDSVIRRHTLNLNKSVL